MYIDARDMSPSKAFCFIIEYSPYIIYIASLQWRTKVHPSNDPPTDRNSKKDYKHLVELVPDYRERMLMNVY